MKKTHSANIGGTVFTVEEDAYEHLRAYLHSIEMHFHSYPDVAEIVADIEARIAEQLMQRETAPQVVRMADVERVIAAMGRTEEFGAEAVEEAPAARVRKLFRDPDQKIIAGVAGGLAAYLGLPPLLVRLVLLVLAFFFGASLIVYALLWALVPLAGSTTDKLQMRGKPLTLAAIDQGVRDGLAPIPGTARNIAAHGITAAGSLIHLVVVAIARALKWAAGIFVVGIASMVMLFFTVSLVVALVNASAPPLHPGGAEFFDIFGGWQHVFKVLVYLVAAVPLAVIIATAFRLFWGVTRINSRGLAGLLAVWVVALLGSAAIWSGSYAEVSRFMDEYPARAEAGRELEAYRAIAATVSPLSDEQAAALLATLVSEHQRQSQESHSPSVPRPWPGPHAWVTVEEASINATEAGNRRVLQSAREYLDAPQLAVIEETMARNTANSRANLQAMRERLERSDR